MIVKIKNRSKKVCENQHLDVSFPSCPRDWIPAFAGMTDGENEGRGMTGGRGAG